MRVCIVVAAAENGVIGKEGDLPWHLPADLKHFKNLTTGHPILMGRKTHESIGRVLPKRRNLVITRNAEYQSEGCEIYHSLGDALKACIGEDDVFIIGGGSIYEKALELNVVDRIYLTEVHNKVAGDTFFQMSGHREWRTVSRERHSADEKNDHDYTFITLDRVS